MLNFEVFLIKLIVICFYCNYSFGIDCNIDCSLNLSVSYTFYFNHVINCFDSNTYDIYSLPLLQSRDIRPFIIYYSLTVINVIELIVMVA